MESVSALSALRDEMKKLKALNADLSGQVASLTAEAAAQQLLQTHAVDAAVKAAEAEMQKQVSTSFCDGMAYAKTFILESRQMK